MSSDDTFTVQWIEGPSGTKFYTRTYRPANPKAVILFVHGFAEHIARYKHFHPRLAAEGIAVFAFDQRGFGLTAQDTEGNKSKDSSYGKTSWNDQMQDIDYMLGHVKETFKGVPLFLMGHSMGGGEVLGFATQDESAETKKHVKDLYGLIATSPLIRQAKPAPKFLRRVGGLVGTLAPYVLIPAPVVPDHLSRDKAVGKAYMEDPLVHQSGSLRGIGDMLSKGEEVLQNYGKWPRELPLLIVHGGDDKVTSQPASQEFFDHVSLEAKDKKYELVKDAYHELQNELPDVQQLLLDLIRTFVKERVANGMPGTSREIAQQTIPVKSKM
ncbi:hypothetical protein AX16_006212 [Volvariella volvacea WC 439]|nr:hypothetical protein AX16_006212 [Volvariella volvacea WC 439]